LNINVNKGKPNITESQFILNERSLIIHGCMQLVLEQWFLTWVRSNIRGSVSQFQDFGGLVHPFHMMFCICVTVMFCWLYSLNTIILCANYAWYSLFTITIHSSMLYVQHICFEFEGKITFYFPTAKGSVNAYMELVALSTSNKVKNHCTSVKGSFPFIRELS